MSDTADPRDIELPVRWSTWPPSAKIEYLSKTLSRDELFVAVALQVELEDVDPATVTATERFRKRQLAQIAYRLRTFRQ